MKHDNFRFDIKYKQRLANSDLYVIIDKLTGVNYIQFGGGLSPALDENGKMIVDRLSE